MSTFKFISFSYPASATPVPLHDGTNTPGQPPPTVAGFVIRPSVDDVILGGPDVDTSPGFSIKFGQVANVVGFLSRGSYQNYELTQIYYVGGPFTLTIEKEAKPS